MTPICISYDVNLYFLWRQSVFPMTPYDQRYPLLLKYFPLMGCSTQSFIIKFLSDIIFSVTLFSQWHYFLSDIIFSVTLFSQWHYFLSGHYFLSDIIFSVALFSQWHYFLSDIIFSVTLFSQWHYFLSDIIFSVTLFSQWHYFLSDIIFSVTLFSQWHYILKSCLAFPKRSSKIRVLKIMQNCQKLYISYTSIC